jgi:hypothetical protein
MGESATGPVLVQVVAIEEGCEIDWGSSLMPSSRLAFESSTLGLSGQLSNPLRLSVVCWVSQRTH